MPRLYALQFDLVTKPPRFTLVIVWPDEPAGNACPVNRHQNWLDVRAGDQIFLERKRRTVATGRVYRGDGAGSLVVKGG